MSGLAALAAPAAGIPVVETFHALGRVKRRYQGEADTSPPARLRLEARSAAAPTAVVATCTDEVSELAAYGAPPERDAVVPCGVDPDRFQPGAARPSAPATVPASSRSAAWSPARAWTPSSRRVPGARRGAPGGGRPERAALDRDPEGRRLMGLAQEHGVADRVVFPGQIAHEATALVRSADVVVSVPWYEPFGIVPIEAMACGVPVIASAVGGHLDTVLDGVTGRAVPPRGRPPWPRPSQLLADPGLRRPLGRAAAPARPRPLPVEPGGGRDRSRLRAAVSRRRGTVWPSRKEHAHDRCTSHRARRGTAPIRGRRPPVSRAGGGGSPPSCWPADGCWPAATAAAPNRPST